MTKHALIFAIVASSCASEQPAISLPLPSQLALRSLPSASRERLRAVASIPGLLAPSELEVDLDAGVARGSFTLPNAGASGVVLTVQFLTGLTAESEEVLIGRTQSVLDIEEGEENRARLADVVTSGEAIFDVNRNGRSNLEDLIAGVEPVLGPMPIDISPSTISFESGVVVGGFTRAFMVIENTGEETTEVTLAVRLAPGVTILPLARLFENGGASTASEQSTVLEPGEEEVFAVTFAPANPLFLLGSISISSRMQLSAVEHSTLVRLLGNPDGAVPQPPAGYEILLPADGTPIGGYTGGVAPYPRDNLFSRAPNLTSAPEVEAGGISAGDTLYDVDFAYMVTILPRHRFSLTLDGLSDDMDVYLFELDDRFAPLGAPAALSRSSGLSSESAEFDATGRRQPVSLLIALDRITDSSATPPLALATGDGATTQTAMYSVPEFLPPCATGQSGGCGPVASARACPATYAGALACGSALGNTQFLLRGRNLTAGARVTVGGLTSICSDVELDVVDGDAVYDVIRCLAPPAAVDPTQQPNATIGIRNPDGQSATLAEGYTYLPPSPQVFAVSPPSGPLTGGMTVTIRGNYFWIREAVPTVTVAGERASGVELLDETQLRAVIPVCSSCTADAPVDVVVTNPDGQQGTLYNGFIYRQPAGPAPTVSSVTPSSGPPTGGTAIAIGGTGFIGGAAVRVGGTTASAVNVVSATEISAITPPGAAGPAAVEVVNPDGQTGRLTAGAAGGFRYVVPDPVVSGVIPDGGPEAGGSIALVTGSGFQAGAVVLFGTLEAEGVTVNGPSSITVATPPGSGIVGVTVVNLDGRSATRAGAFTYEAPSGPPPTVASLTPAQGSTPGGSEVLVSGSGFEVGAQVLFGLVSSPSVSVTSPSSLTALVPAHPEGLVDITVKNPDGQRGQLPAAFTYFVPPPQVLSLFPPEGGTAGGTAVLVNGSGFQPGAYVRFGSAMAAQVVTGSSTTITCRTPAGIAGPVDVTVVNPDGQSNSLAGAFTYRAPEPLTVANVLPASGPTSGGTIVFISGTGFDSAAVVLFGSVPAASVVISSPQSITATSPASIAGTVGLTVRNPNGASTTRPSAFTFQTPTQPPPFISSVTPSSGPAEGLTRVEIGGQSFSAGARVFFGGIEAQTLAAESSATLLVVLTPAGSADTTVAIRVENSDGQSYTRAAAFTYTAAAAPLSVSAVSPTDLDATRSTSVFVVGQSFAVGDRVRVTDGAWVQEATGVIVIDDNLISATLPAYGGAIQRPVVTASITVTQRDGATATLPSAVTYHGVSECDPTDPRTCPQDRICGGCAGAHCSCVAPCSGQPDGTACLCGGSCMMGQCYGSNRACHPNEVCQGGSCVDNCAVYGSPLVSCPAGQVCDPTSRQCFPKCNNDGVRQYAEMCDGTDLGDAYCLSLGYLGGTLRCDASCRFDTSYCVAPQSCGNGVTDYGESCDPPMISGGCSNPGPYTTPESMVCSDACRVDQSHCGPMPLCGNGSVEAPYEECEGAQSRPCMELALGQGTATCVGCRYDVSGCSMQNCGNDRIDVEDAAQGSDRGEICDGTLVGTLTCRLLGFAGGTLACSSCAPDVSGCTAAAASCFNGTLGSGETDVDCGGSCPPCAEGLACAADTDCLTGNCTAGFCAPASCTNSKRDGWETDLDCGRSWSFGAAAGCPSCAGGQSCTFDWDCQSNNCSGGVCTSGTGGGCSAGQFDCQEPPSGGPCIMASLVCNGMSDCANGRDESTCGGCPVDSFDCGDGSCIPLSMRCNGVPNCANNADETACSACGNGMIDGTEQCDGSNLGAESCASLGFTGGTLSCNATCQYNTSGCAVCGDSMRVFPEECDGTDLAGQSCSSLGYDSGMLACSACMFDTSGCVRCGDGVRNGPEQCEGSDLGGMTCTGLGYMGGGPLACSAGCTYDASGCLP